MNYQLPSQVDLLELIEAVRENLKTYSYEELETATLTIGWHPTSGSWSYQTGDNSFTGNAYGYPCWAVVEVCRETDEADCADLIDSIHHQLDEGAAP